ncbi:MAG TPA: zinc ribbon domain-containing protein [Pyrinomonadaceae bacterium]|nr:zinc ribbon domain-containing protein [Pyrinomonadaceae bacterium]
MHCPKCGQEQLSEEMSFCSRCGFSLNAVKALIASSGGLLEQQIETSDKELSKGRKSVRRATFLMLAGLLLTLITGFLAAIDDVFAVFLLIPALVWITSFLLLLYGVFFADKRAHSQKRVASQVPALPGELSSTAGYLPPAHPQRTFPPQRVETAEMVQPRSVTENTTRLLDDEPNLRRS